VPGAEPATKTPVAGALAAGLAIAMLPPLAVQATGGGVPPVKVAVKVALAPGASVTLAG